MVSASISACARQRLELVGDVEHFVQHELHVAQRRGVLGHREDSWIDECGQRRGLRARRRRDRREPGAASRSGATHALEAGARALERAGDAQEARVVVQRQDQAVDLEQHLLRRRCRRAGGLRRSAMRIARSQRRVPGAAPSSTSASRTGPGPVVELDRAADVDAARVDLDRDALHPAVEQRAQPRQAARRRASPGRTPLPRSCAWYSRTTEICSSSREPKWANTPDLLICVTSASAPIDRPSRPICDGQAERGVEDRGAGLLALHRAGARRRPAERRAVSWRTSESRCGRSASRAKSNDRAILHGRRAGQRSRLFVVRDCG